MCPAVSPALSAIGALAGADSSEATAALISQHNRRLAAAGLRLRLEMRGGKLSLRGPLPCRTGAGHDRVQRLSLALPATAAGVGEALERLREAQRQLELGQFDWARWSRRPAHRPAKSAGGGASPAPGDADGWGAQVQAFKLAFFADPRRRLNPAGSRTTWSAAYRPYLRRLLQLSSEAPGARSESLLRRTLESYAPGSRSRQQCGTALAALARERQLELPPDWAAQASGYGLHLARYRQLPSDAEILGLLERIPNPGWRLVYGLLATYGLRNHEAFFADLSALAPGADRVIRVLPTSKTGEHQVWPFQPHWVDHFGLAALAGCGAALPPVTTNLGHTTLQQVGRRVAEQFRRYALPITPYDLRHAWAVRTIHIGLPDTVAARMMGHSVAIHTRTYHHWITRRDQQQAVDAALARGRSE